MNASTERHDDAPTDAGASTPSTEPWFDEAVVVDEDWAVIYTKREDGTRRGIRVPLRAVLTPDDETDPTAVAS